MTMLTCPLCGSHAFEEYRGVPHIQCSACKSNERTRATKLFLDRYVRLQRGSRVLHLAPEPSLGRHIVSIVGPGYDPADKSPEHYARTLGRRVKRLDLCAEARRLPGGFYDLVLHNHVIEHVPCNYTIVLQHLHRAVKPGGVHLFSIPVTSGHFAEDLSPALSEEDRSIRFTQRDHMRRFGRSDFDRTAGAVFNLTAAYSLTDFFSEDELRRANIRESQWRCSGSSVFYLRVE
jgi:phosphoglycolate phosphatase